MTGEECKIELRPDEKLGWRLLATGKCKKILEEINNNQGPYSKRHFNQRVIVIDEAGTPESSDTNKE